MQELIYLSRSKLNQFMKRPGRLVIKGIAAELRVPFASGSISIENDNEKWSAAYRRLSQVKRSMAASARAPRWFEDHRAEPGEWIEFEGSMVYAVIHNRCQRLLFFTQASDSTCDTRLLLYGSPNNLLSNESAVSNNADLLNSTVDSLARFMEELIHTRETNLIGASQEWLHNGAASILDQMRTPLITRAYAEGWAKVIAISKTSDWNTTFADQYLDDPHIPRHPDRILIASPLYVQHIENID